MIHSPVTFLVDAKISRVEAGSEVVRTMSGLHNYDSLLVLINVTKAGVAGGTLTLFIQDTWDQGRTWDDLITSTGIVYGTTTGVQRFVVQGRIATTITQGSPPINQQSSYGTVRQGPFGDTIRLVERLTALAGTPTGAEYTVSVIPCRSENN